MVWLELTSLSPPTSAKGEYNYITLHKNLNKKLVWEGILTFTRTLKRVTNNYYIMQ